MAYQAQLSALVDELLLSVKEAGWAAPSAIDRDFALRTIRHHGFARTNHFAVAEQLDGLEEKLRIHGRDALADELRGRLDALEENQGQGQGQGQGQARARARRQSTKCVPEILHFLLELSDRPVVHARLADLEILRQARAVEDPGVGLTWDAIAAEDGWGEDRALWSDVDFADHSGNDGGYDDDASDTSAFSSDTAFSSPDRRRQKTIEDLVIPSSKGGVSVLEKIEASQAWRHAVPLPKGGDGRPRKIPLSGPHVLREVLFMLAGLETSLFDASYNPVLKYQLRGLSWDTHKALVTSFAEQGRSLAHLRRFAAIEQEIPLLQVFQHSVQKSLHDFDRQLARIQARFVEIGEDVVVSLISLSTELKADLAPLRVLSDIVQQLQREGDARVFRYLELLFDAAGIAQLEGNEATYRFLGTIFFDCFQVYLRPIRTWMEEGSLSPGDRTFFVSETAGRTPLHQMWANRFRLEQTSDGTLHAPQFLQPAIQRIFATGKSVVVLKHLGRYESLRGQWQGKEPRIDFDSVCAADLVFAPFSEAFSSAFRVWIESKHHTASSTLRELLFRSYGLSSGLDTYQSIYLMCDGSLSDALAESVFRRLDDFSDSWKDRLALTEIAQDAFSSPCLDAFRLSAQLDPGSLVQNAVVSRSSVRISLPAIRLSYRLNWQVQIIMSDDAVQGYQAMFTFLLQIRRALYMLHGQYASLKNNNTGKRSKVAHPRDTYYLLRTRLLWFCSSLLSYLTTLVIAPNSAQMRAGLRDALDVDDMISVHSNFVKQILSESCLGPKLLPIRECILDLLDLAIRLEDSAAKASVGGGDDDDDYYGDGDDEGCGSTDYEQALREMHADFEKRLRFVTGGLRGVARASREEAAGKWDLLAEMLEVGIRDSRHYVAG